MIGQLLPFLTWLYSREILSQAPGNHLFPVTIKPVDASQLIFEQIEDHRVFPSTSSVLEELRQSRSKIWNGRTFVFRNMLPHGEAVKIQYSEGYYFDTINTCSVLERELYHVLKNSSSEDFEELYDRMTCRKQVHHGKRGLDTLSSLWNGESLSSALGISCLFTVNIDGEYYLCIRKRSSQVADNPDFYHVVPSMLFQPGERIKVPDIKDQVFKEIAEELFSYSEEKNLDIKAEVEETGELYLLLKDGGAEFLVTAMAVDLISLRHEILSVMIIHDPGWFKKHQARICFCDFEYEKGDPMESFVPLSKINKELIPGISSKITPAGIASILAGLPAVNKSLQNRGECKSPPY